MTEDTLKAADINKSRLATNEFEKVFESLFVQSHCKKRSIIIIRITLQDFNFALYLLQVSKPQIFHLSHTFESICPMSWSSHCDLVRIF